MFWLVLWNKNIRIMVVICDTFIVRKKNILLIYLLEVAAQDAGRDSTSCSIILKKEASVLLHHNKALLPVISLIRNLPLASWQQTKVTVCVCVCVWVCHCQGPNYFLFSERFVLCCFRHHRSLTPTAVALFCQMLPTSSARVAVSTPTHEKYKLLLR